MSEWDAFPAAQSSDWDAFPVASGAAPSIGPEIVGGVTGAIKTGAGQIADYLNPFSEARHASYAKQAQAPLSEALAENLRQLGGVGSALATPITVPGGIVNAVVAPPVARGFQAVNQLAGVDLPYDKAKEQTETALMGLAPRGFSPTGARPGPPRPAPSVDELAAAKTADYNHPAVTDLRLSQRAIQDLRQSIDHELLQNRIDRFSAPEVNAAVTRLQEPRFAGDATVADIDMARQTLGNVPHEQRRAASIARNVIDNYLGNIPQADLVAGNAARANAFLQRARANAAAEFRARDIDSALHNAEVQAGSTYSGGNLNNATRQQLRPLLRVRRGATNYNLPGWTDAEMAQLSNAVLGTTTGNVARAIGKLGPTGGLMGLGHAEAAIRSGGASLPLTAATSLARHIGNRSTANQAAILSELLRSRSPLAQAAPPLGAQRPSTLSTLIAQLLSSSAGRPLLPYFPGQVPAHADENNKRR